MQYLLLILTLILSVSAQVLLKQGVAQSDLTPTVTGVLQTIFSPLVFAGFLLYGLSAVIWLFVLQKLPLSVAYPAFALTYVVVVLLGVVFLREPFNVMKGLGILFIFIGVACLFK